MSMRRALPAASTPYELAMWVSFTLFYGSLFSLAASVWFMWGMEAFGALLFLTIGCGVGAMLGKELHFENRLGQAHAVGPAPDPRQDLFDKG